VEMVNKAVWKRLVSPHQNSKNSHLRRWPSTMLM